MLQYTPTPVTLQFLQWHAAVCMAQMCPEGQAQGLECLLPCLLLGRVDHTHYSVASVLWYTICIPGSAAGDALHQALVTATA